MKNALIALLIVAVTGCISTPVPVSQATPVPADRYFWTEKPKTANPGKLIVVRNSGFIGSAVKADVTIDQKPLAALDMGEKVEVLLDPDSYVLDIDVAYVTSSANQDIKAGQTYYYRISVDSNAITHLSRIKRID